MEKSFSDSLISLRAFVALLLAILLSWQFWNQVRLKAEIAFAEEQTRIFDEMQQRAIRINPSEAAEALAHVENY
jgi:predicted HAD superfamily hydrolase